MSVYDHRCADCQVCPNCGRSAWCEGDRILVIPCEHHGFCGDCCLTECEGCKAEAEMDIDKALANAAATVSALLPVPTDDDPLAPRQVPHNYDAAYHEQVRKDRERGTT